MADHPSHFLILTTFKPLGACLRSLTLFLYQVCDKLFNGSFGEEQKVVQGVVASVEMYSSLMRKVNLDCKFHNKPRMLLSRFPSSSSRSSSAPGATVPAGSCSYSSLLLATSSSVSSSSSTSTSSMSSTSSSSG